MVVMANPLLDALARAVEAQPDDVSLRLHLAGLLLADGQSAEAIRHCAIVLQTEPANSEAHQLLAAAAGQGQQVTQPEQTVTEVQPELGDETQPEAPEPSDEPTPTG